MGAWLASVWAQVWPNILADAIGAAPFFLWHHRHITRLLHAHRQELADLPSRKGQP